MDTNGIKTYSGFNINGRDMSYTAMQKRAQRKDFAQKENEIYSKKFEAFKKNSQDLKNQSYIAFSIAGAAVLCQILFKHFNRIKFEDIKSIEALARKMVEKFKLNEKGFRAVITDKNQTICKDIYGKTIKIPDKKTQSSAFYILPANIAIARKDSPLALFHEIGHAVTGCKKYGYNWHKFVHYFPYLSLLPAATCLINTTDKDKKLPDKQKIYNALNFIKDNSYLTSLATFLPMLAEEFNASRLAVTFLSKNAPELALKSLQLLVPAFGTYLLTALAFSNLVKLLNTKSDNIYLQKSLYKQSKDYEKTLKFDNSISPQIAIIDEYKTKVVKIDRDDKPDMLHGEAVETFIKAGLPGAKITRFDTNLDEASVKKALEEIINSSVKYDAINISKSSDIKISDLSSLIGYKITAKSLKQDKDIIKERFFASPYKEAQEIKGIVKDMELLASKGVKIYVSAGNKGKDYLNLYTLADRVNVIGASNKYGVVKAGFSCDNALVTRWSKGVFDIKKVKDTNGHAGFDINENLIPDIAAKDTTSKFKIPQRHIYGTSFAAPNALVYDLKKVIED